MSKKIRFAIYGCGLIANTHVRALQSMEKAEIAGVCDLKPERAREFANKYGVERVFQNYNEVLDSPDVDVVCVCTPSGTHAELGIMALERGKNVVLEKPMAITVADCDKIIAAKEKSGKRVLVISQLRAHADVRRAKSIIDSGALGKLCVCDVFMKYYRPETYYHSSWRGTKAMDGGGALMNQGIHGVDILLHLCGDVKDVRSIVRTQYHDIEVEDTAVAILEFENGAVGMIETTTCAYPGFNRRIEISGSDGSIVLNEGALERLVLRNEGVNEYTPIEISEKASDPRISDITDHKNQISEFVEVLLGDETIAYCDEHEGRRAVALIEKIYNSSL